MDSEKTLVLISAAFPLGGVTEQAFIQPEIEALASAFDRVIILPLSEETGKTEIPALPENVTVDRSLLGTPSAGKKLSLFFHPSVALHIPGDLPYMRKPGHLRQAVAESVYATFYRHRLEKWIRDNRIPLSRTLFYTFWFNYATNALAGIHNARIVTRAHGYDIFDYTPNLISHSWRRDTLREILACFPASEHGARYLRNQYLESGSKIRARRLGCTAPTGLNPDAGDDCPLTLLSCARLAPVKGVLRQIRFVKEWARRNPGIKVRWICIGHGAERPLIEKEILDLPENLEAEMMGELPNSDVRKLLQTRHIDLMILLSHSEGCPIAPCEAISCGVPILCTDAGGSREIANSLTGKLLPLNPSADEFCAAVDALRPRLAQLRESARQFWEMNFDSGKLRRDFARELAAML